MVTASLISKDRTFELFLIIVEKIQLPTVIVCRLTGDRIVYNKAGAERVFAEEMALYRRALV
jgi:hypothetical protein